MRAKRVPCHNCGDTGFVCENHTNKPWNGPQACGCGAAGMPCPICNRASSDEPPDNSRHGINVTSDSKPVAELNVTIPNAPDDGLAEMEDKTLNEMRAVAASAALQRGHRMGNWSAVFDDRSRFRFKSNCKDCHSWIEIKNWKVVSEEAQRVAQAGFLVVQDKNAISDLDYVVAMGAALIIDCWERP